MTPTVLIAAAAAYAVASAFFLAWLVRYEPRARRSGALVTVAATALAGVAVVTELGGLAGPPALRVGAQVMLLLVFGVSLLFLASRLRTDMPVAGPVVAPLAAAVVFVLAVKAVRGDLPPSGDALGAITAIHIGATLLGFLLFVPAYVLSVLFLHQQYHLKTKTRGAGNLPSLLRLEAMSWRLLFIGFPLYSVGILLGFVWQERAGPAAGPRPEHVLSAVSWLVYAYATYRHLKTGWRGRRAALTLMAAFVVTLAAVMLYVMR